MHKRYFLLLLFSIVLISTEAQVQLETYTYIKNDSTQLDLDFFPSKKAIPLAPLLIYVHGGGFSNGNRSAGHEICRYAADSGINAATISYTLSMKGKKFSCDGIQSEKIKAIQMAAYQIRVATQWFTDRAEEFGIDTNKIFLSGSSAGAEAILQAAFWNNESENYFPSVLSKNFKYAGLISGAGALLDINMINKETKIPVLCYHGTCDPLVPYYIGPHHYCSQISSGFVMMFGGLAIHERIQELNGSSHLMSYCNEGHKHAGTPFFGAEKKTVVNFIYRTLNGEKLNIHRVFKNGAECKMGLDFVFCY